MRRSRTETDGPSTAETAGAASPSPATSSACGPAQGDRRAKTIEAARVNLFYGDFHAVEDVTMTIEPNKVTALIGSSGCGKTTFLRSLNRMHELTAGARVEGEITLDGEDIYAKGVDPVEVRRLVGMVFQAPNPFPTMSIYENVAAGLNLNAGRIGKSEKDEVVERACAARTSGRRSRTGSASRARASPAASSSGSASPARSPSSPRCC